MKIEENLTHYRKFFIKCEKELDDFWCFIQNEDICSQEMAFIYHISSEILYDYLHKAERLYGVEKIIFQNLLKSRKKSLLNISFYKNFDESVFFEIDNSIFTSKVKRHINRVDLDIEIKKHKTLIKAKKETKLDEEFISKLKDNDKKLKDLPNSCEGCKSFVDFDNNIKRVEAIKYPKIDAKDYLEKFENRVEIELLTDELIEIISDIKDSIYLFEERNDIEQLIKISRHLSYFSMSIKHFIEFFTEFEEFANALDEMALDISFLSQKKFCNIKLILIIKNFIDDLESWLILIFKEQRAIDIHYLDNSLILSVKEFSKLSRKVIR